jgi:hypothetical protein
MGGGGGGNVRRRGLSTAVRLLVGRRKSVCSACGCVARGNGELGVDVGAGSWDRRSQWSTDVCARSVGGAGWRGQARTRGPVPKPFGVTCSKAIFSKFLNYSGPSAK